MQHQRHGRTAPVTGASTGIGALYAAPVGQAAPAGAAP